MAIKQGRAVQRCVTSKGMREMTMEEFKVWLKGFDKDGDGRISKYELRDAICSVGGGWFKTWKSGRGIRSADDNRDGFVDDNEINYLVDFAQKQLGVKIVPY